MNNFLDELKNLFPEFNTEWDINELPYLFFGDFACYIENNSNSIDMKNIDYILNLFLELSFDKDSKENIVVAGFLEVLHDNEQLYKMLKDCSSKELKRIIDTYMSII
ncbi:MAG: hypothetical protein IK024_09295 [Treponema sp.]|nr:hypothetical protein [Treponema sp.]